MIAEHQKAFAKSARPYEGLWHGTGTGKTRTGLYTVKKHDGSILVIAPKTTVQKKQWQKEAKSLGMKEPTVISKEMFRRDHATLPRYKAVIVDEAHNVFGVTANMHRAHGAWVPKASQLFEALHWYVTERAPDRLILATATPNKTPMSIWAAAKLLGHDWSFREFRDEFYHRLPMDRIVYAPNRGPKAIEALAERTRSIGQVLRLEDIKDVPEQTYRTVTFPLTSQQTTALKTLPGRFTDISALRMKRHQVENGVLYEDVFEKQKIVRKTERFDCEKVDYIVDRALEFPKMVIFANYTEQIAAIAAALKEQDLNVFVLTGQSNDRKEVCEAAESMECAYIVAQASVSSEWEFKTCPVVIFASLSNRSIDYIQGQGRVQRYDAVKHNLYIHLVTQYKDSVDEKWFDTIMNGRDFNEALYDDK